MFHFKLLQISPEDLEWFKQQPDFWEAYDEFSYSNSITCSFGPDQPTDRDITLEDYDASLLMTSVNPPLEGWFSPDEILFSRALVYGKHVIDRAQNLTYNSAANVAIIASELENLPLARLRVIFEEGAVRYGKPGSSEVDCGEEVLQRQSALFQWVTEFYQSARAHGYAVLLHWD